MLFDLSVKFVSYRFGVVLFVLMFVFVDFKYGEAGNALPKIDSEIKKNK